MNTRQCSIVAYFLFAGLTSAATASWLLTLCLNNYVMLGVFCLAALFVYVVFGSGPIKSAIPI